MTLAQVTLAQARALWSRARGLQAAAGEAECAQKGDYYNKEAKF